MLMLFFSLAVFQPQLSQCALVGRCSPDQQGAVCTQPNAYWQRDGICFSEVHKTPSCYVPNTRNFSFIIVAVIATLGDKAIPYDLWIKGSGPELSWENTTKMRTLKKGYWDIYINYTYDSNSLLCYNKNWCYLNQKAMEFRFYQDSRGEQDMVGHNFFLKLPVSNSMVHHHDFEPPPVYFFPSFSDHQVFYRHFILHNNLHYRPYNQPINATLFFPPSYEYNLHKRYPVVVVLGNDLHLQLVHLLESMFVFESNIKEAFVIAIPHSGRPPYCAYNPFIVYNDRAYTNFPGNLIWNCSNSTRGYSECMRCMECYITDRQGLCDAISFAEEVERCGNRPSECRGHGGALVDSLINIVIPELSYQTKGRMLTNYPKERISIIGIDGGGLLACFAALSRPLVFINAACLSAPFHWPLRSVTTKESRKEQGIGFLLREIEERLKIRKELVGLYLNQKYFIDVDKNDNKYLPIVDAYNYSDWVVQQLMEKIYISPSNIQYHKYMEGQGNSYMHMHTEGDRRIINRIKAPLLFFLKPQGGFRAAYPRSMIIKNSHFSSRKNSIINEYNISDDDITILDKDVVVDCDKYQPTLPPTVSVYLLVTSICKFFYSFIYTPTCMYVHAFKHALYMSIIHIENTQDHLIYV